MEIQIERNEGACHFPTAGMGSNMQKQTDAADVAQHETMLFRRPHCAHSRRPSFVVLQQAAQRFVTDEFLQRELLDEHQGRKVGQDGYIADALLGGHRGQPVK
jgi:hypothetical protein